MNYNVMIWGIIAGSLIIMELITPALICIWFAISAFLIMFISIFIKDISIQLFLFFALSFGMLFISKKILSKYLKSKINFDSSAKGQIVIITKYVAEGEYEVKYKGVIWTAYSKDKFNINEVAYINEFKGNKIIIQREEIK